MWFVLAAILFMFIGRKAGWRLSRTLYRSNSLVAALGAVAWGILIAFCVSGLIEWQHPGYILKWIFGFALGAYVAIPNYGLLNEATLPIESVGRHTLVKQVPFVVYILAEIAIRWV